VQINPSAIGANALRKLLTDEGGKGGGKESATPPERWEYRGVSLSWDLENEAYTAEFSDGARLVGIGNILNRYGDEGWVLASFVPNRWTGGRVTVYYAVLMRRR
jgi:hypothetical protein